MTVATQTLVDDIDLRDLSSVLAEHADNLQVLKCALMAPWPEVTEKRNAIVVFIARQAKVADMIFHQAEKLGVE